MAEIELWVKQGQNLSHQIKMTNPVTNTAINIASYTNFTGRLKKSYITNNISANLTFTKTDASNGVVLMTLGHTETEVLYPMKYVFDVSCVSPTNEKLFPLDGIIIVQPKV